MDSDDFSLDSEDLTSSGKSSKESWRETNVNQVNYAI